VTPATSPLVPDPVGELAARLAADDRVVGAVRLAAPIGPLTTYRAGGSAAMLFEPGGIEELRAIGEARRGLDVDVVVVGRGSNLLVADAGFDGVAVLLDDRFGGVDLDLDAAVVDAGGAASLPVVARRTAAAALTGFEWAVGVPGSIGGAVRMNAGGHGSDMAACVERVRVVDLDGGEYVEVAAGELDFSYRHSAIRPTQVVVGATLALRHGDAAAAEAEIADIVRWRREHQPGGANAGSVFTNPDGDSAGRLVDAAGCRGLRVGSAEVSRKHANFIQVDPGGRADDVVALMGEVRRRVADAHGVDLRAETCLVGFDSASVERAGGRP
jgi:UDP-N-acetylmuramate dehydrogenase